MSAQSAKKALATKRTGPPKGPKKFLTIEDIRDAKDITQDDIWVEPWEGWVTVRSLSKSELDLIISKSTDDDGEMDEEEMQKLIFLTGLKNPVVSEEEYPIIQEKSAAAFYTILRDIMERSNLNGLSGQEKLEKRFRS